MPIYDEWGNQLTPGVADFEDLFEGMPNKKWAHDIRHNFRIGFVDDVCPECNEKIPHYCGECGREMEDE